MKKKNSESSRGPVVVIKNPDNPEPEEVIAASILEVDRGMQKLLSGPLKMKTIVTLVQAHTKLGKGEIESVLNCLAELKKIYLK